ncbi:unnamed protein product [Closterium sp. NIES-53]
MDRLFYGPTTRHGAARRRFVAPSPAALPPPASPARWLTHPARRKLRRGPRSKPPSRPFAALIATLLAPVARTRFARPCCSSRPPSSRPYLSTATVAVGGGGGGGGRKRGRGWRLWEEAGVQVEVAGCGGKGKGWLTRDAAAYLAVRNHLPLAERAHFGQHKTGKALYDAVDARYSSPTTAALGRLIPPYLFPDLSAFATVEDLITHLCTSDTRYRAALKAEFLDKNPPPMYITLYFIVTRLPNSLRVVRDHFLALDPTGLTVDLLEKHLLAAETSIVAVGASRCTPRTPFFEGCSPSPLAPSYTSAAAVNILGAEDVGAASA